MRRFWIVLVGLLFAAAPAHADPISAVIVTVLSYVGVTASVAAVTSFLVSTAISIGLSYISQAISGGGPKAQQQNPFGITTTLQSGGTVPRKFIIGTYATGGSEIYPARTWGQDGKTPNAYFTRFIALQDLPSNGLAGFIVDGKPCTYGAGAPDASLGYAIPEYSKDGKDHLWVKFHDGSQTEADAWAASRFGSDPDYPYGVDQVGYGVSYAIVTALIEPTLFSSFPGYVFVVSGISLYDPRADSSVGGSGPQRFADPTSWQPTANPAIVKYNILRGISWNGQWLYGLQNTAAERLPLDSWFAAMNVCDALVAYQPEVAVPQFRCGGEVGVDTAPADLLDELNKADNGRIAEIGGIFKTRSGAVGAAVMSFSDADLLVTEAQNFEQFPGLEATTNGVTAAYPEPIQNWAMTDAPALYSDALEQADGGRRLIADVKYNLVPFGDQVQFLVKSARDEARKFRKHTVVAPPRAALLDPLDVIAWSSVVNGYTAKLFTVVPTDQENIDQGLTLQEVDPADYDWDPAVHYRSYTPIPIVPHGPGVQAMSGWTVAGEIVDGGGGRQAAGIRISWDTAGIDDVSGVLYQVRRASDSALVLAGEMTHFSLGTVVVSAPTILPQTNYQARGKYRPTTPNRETDWSDWLDVTTPAMKIVGDDLANALITFGKFAAGITPVQQVDDLADAITGDGFTAVLTTDGKLYRYHGGVWTAAVLGTDISGGGVIGLGASLPGSGTQGDVFFLTTNNKLYRYTGSAWTVSTDGGDISATSIGAGAIAAGAITAGKIAAGAVTAGTIDANAVVSGTIAAGAISAGNEIVTNLIVTGHLVANSVTSTSGAYNPSGEASLGVVIDSDVYATIIWASADDGAAGIFGMAILRDGTPISSVFVCYFSGMVMIIDNPGAGTYTYSLDTSGLAAQSTIVITRLRR